jgi:hypothetical protein
MGGGKSVKLFSHLLPAPPLFCPIPSDLRLSISDLSAFLVCALISRFRGAKLTDSYVLPGPPFPTRPAAMPLPLSAPEVLAREFLEIRCKILELAASFDRLTRAEGSVEDDPRLARLREALTAVLEDPADRAEQVQMIFSRAYEDDWQKTFKVAPR